MSTPAASAAEGGGGPVNDMDVIEALCFFSMTAATGGGGTGETKEQNLEQISSMISAAPAIYPPPPALKIQCDPPSSKARFKCYPTLVRLCSRYGRSPTDHHISVCEGRKTVHVLNDGEVDHLACFIGNETPGASFRVRKTSTATNASKSEMQSSYLRSIVVPNGWKVAVVDEGHLFTAEARVSVPIATEGTVATPAVMEYRFASVNERGEEENPAGWYSNLCEAFRKVSQPLEDKKVTKTHRYNGKLLLGLHYHNPQLKVQQFVRKQFHDGKFSSDVQLQTKVEEWLDNCEKERLRAAETAAAVAVPDQDAKKQKLEEA